jgi:hypothetical protein
VIEQATKGLSTKGPGVEAQPVSAKPTTKGKRPQP